MQPLLGVAIEARRAADREALNAAVRRQTGADPELTFGTDAESGLLILEGPSEAALETAVDALRRDASVDLHVGHPMVVYRETLGGPADVDYTHKQQTGGIGQFARVKIRFAPGEPGSGFIFEATINAGAVPHAFIPGVRAGLEAARQAGLLAGFPVIDFSATLYDGGFHDVDSTGAAFELAARDAFRKLKPLADPVLLEPWMHVAVRVRAAPPQTAIRFLPANDGPEASGRPKRLAPGDHLDAIVGDLHARRGQVQGTDVSDDDLLVTALAPLSNLLGYPGDLRRMTAGSGEVVLRFSHHAPVPLRGETPDPPFPGALGMRASADRSG